MNAILPQRVSLATNPGKLDLSFLNNLSVVVRVRRGVSADDVDARIDEIVRNHRKVRARKSGQKVALGDEVTVDLVAYLAGAVCLVERGVDVVVADEGRWAPMLTALVGLEVGAQKALPVTFGPQGPSGLANKTIGLAVTVHRAAGQLPCALDEALERAGYGTDIGKARARIKEELMQARSEALVASAKERAIDAISRELRWPIEEVAVDGHLMDQFGEREALALENAGVPAQRIAERRAAFVADPAMRKAAKREVFIERFLDEVADQLGFKSNTGSVLERMTQVASKKDVNLISLKAALRRRSSEMRSLAAEERRARALEAVLERMQIEFV